MDFGSFAALALVSVPAMSEKDAADLRFALHLGADLIALSFVRSPDDIKLVHEIMAEEGKFLPVIAKVEADLEKARAAGDAKKTKTLEDDLASRQAFLDMARRASADFGG